MAAPTVSTNADATHPRDAAPTETPGAGPGKEYAGWPLLLVTAFYLTLVTVGLIYAMVKIWPYPTLSGESARAPAGQTTPPAVDTTKPRPSDTTVQKTGVTRNQSPAERGVTLASASFPLSLISQGAGKTDPAPGGQASPDNRDVQMVRGYPGRLVCPDTVPRVWMPVDSLRDPSCVSLFTRQFAIWKEQRLFLIVMFAGALGAVLRALGSLVLYTGTRWAKRSWMLQYYVQPFRGAILGIVFYLLLRGGLFSSSAPLGDTSPAGFAAVAALVGLFEKEATRKLQMIADALFAPHQQNVEKAPSGEGKSPAAPEAPQAPPRQAPAQAPVIEAIEPAMAAAGSPSQTVIITGSGFAAGAVVNVTRTEAPPLDVRRQPTKASADAIILDLTKEDLAVAGSLSLAVVNPDPPGGTSAPQAIVVA